MNFIEKNFLKIRKVIAIDADSFAMHDIPHAGVIVDVLSPHIISEQKKEKIISFLSKYIGRKRVLSRFERNDWNAHFAETNTGELLGYCWTLSPRSSAVWHDKFRINPDEGLLINVFVLPEHRGRGVFQLIMSHALNYLFIYGKCHRVYAIVEKNNKVSMAAFTKLGLRWVMTNVLLKFMGRNLMSIYWNGKKLSVYWVFRNEKGFSF